MSEYQENHHPFAVHADVITLPHAAAEKAKDILAHAGNAIMHFTGAAVDFVRTNTQQLRH